MIQNFTIKDNKLISESTIELISFALAVSQSSRVSK